MTYGEGVGHSCDLPLGHSCDLGRDRNSITCDQYLTNPTLTERDPYESTDE